MEANPSMEACHAQQWVRDLTPSNFVERLKKTNLNRIHDVGIAVKRILEYMKHQIRDQQQNQAKAYCFKNITEWIIKDNQCPLNSSDVLP